MSEPDRPRRPFLLGLKDSFGLPAIGLFAALTGYGVMSREAGFDIALMLVSVATIWAMPILMAFIELVSSKASAWLLFVTIFAIGFRNLPMSVSAIPMIREKPGFRWSHVALSQLLSPTSWVQITVVGRSLEPRERAPYYVGFSLMLIASGIVGAWVGYTVTQGFPPVVSLALLFLTPLFVIMVMATSPKLSSRLALLAGGAGVPLCMQLDNEWGLILGGIVFGSAGYLLARVIEQRPRRSGS